jgi:oligopeptide transport system ATP-binding protein
MPILDVSNLRVSFHTRNGIVRAVSGVSLSVPKGSTVGIVGESGSGKSVTCFALLGLLPSPPAPALTPRHPDQRPPHRLHLQKPE